MPRAIWAAPCVLAATPVTCSRVHVRIPVRQDKIIERHRHRYEFNNNYREVLQQHGLAIAGTSEDGSLVEVVELPDHPWFVACSFTPNSPPRRATASALHRLYSGGARQSRRTLHQTGSNTMKLCGFEVGLDKPFS